MKIEKKRGRRRPKQYLPKPEFEGKHPVSGDDGLFGKPQWSSEQYREMDRDCLRALSRHHANMLPRARALNSIMDQLYWAR